MKPNLTIENKAACPGCGLVLLKGCLPPPDGLFNALAGCRELYDELSAYTWSLDYSFFLHQHVVDAYGASHAGGPSKPVTTFFALGGLYLALDENYTGRQVQKAHMKMGAKKKDWPLFVPPARTGTVTVADVLAAPPGAKRDAVLMDWCRSVWETWTPEHGRVKKLVRELLAR